ncbi:ABC transporter permease [Amycolatopsis sp. NBRC 101858]|uniref:ABC transporter permease n=1 Tax=Amycolatopsis TaxID=1813 RepID=UPI0024A58494|nr:MULTISPECIES: ABC transporter permease [unclassified Amycolatopsis]GLY39356.1 ABC transporter permease [Amycolatopsis sp. NBRC 101858]
MTTATASLPETKVSPGIGNTLAAEWTKLKSVRSTWLVVIAAAVVSVGFSVLFSFLTEQDYKNLPAGQTMDFDSAGTAMVGMNLGLILISVLGVLAVSGEYSTGMMRLTLAITPHRGRVLISKAVVVGLLAFVLGTLFAAAAFFIGQLVLGINPAIPTLGLGGPGVLRSLLGWGAEFAAFALLALSFGVMMRSAAGAIATAIGFIFAPAILGALLPQWVQRDILAYFPASAAEQLSTAQLKTDSVTYLGPLTGGGTLLTWVAVALVVAFSLMGKRDSG